MKRDLNLPFLDPEGKKYGDVSTLRDIVYGALRAGVPADERSTLTEKAKVFELAMRVVAGGIIEVTADELKAITDRIPVVFANPTVCIPAIRLLEQDYAEPSGG